MPLLSKSSCRMAQYDFLTCGYQLFQIPLLLVGLTRRYICVSYMFWITEYLNFEKALWYCVNFLLYWGMFHLVSYLMLPGLWIARILQQVEEIEISGPVQQQTNRNPSCRDEVTQAGTSGHGRGKLQAQTFCRHLADLPTFTYEWRKKQLQTELNSKWGVSRLLFSMKLYTAPKIWPGRW